MDRDMMSAAIKRTEDIDAHFAKAGDGAAAIVLQCGRRFAYQLGDDASLAAAVEAAEEYANRDGRREGLIATTDEMVERGLTAMAGYSELWLLDARGPAARSLVRSILNAALRGAYGPNALADAARVAAEPKPVDSVRVYIGRTAITVTRYPDPDAAVTDADLQGSAAMSLEE